MKLLIADDDVDTLRLMRQTFGNDFTIIEKATSSSAVNAKADIAILDYMFDRDMSGADLAVKLREKNPEMKIIIYTAMTGGKHFRDARLVCDRIIQKEIRTNRIETAVRDLRKEVENGKLDN